MKFSELWICKFLLSARSRLLDFPVASFRPSEPAKVMALDIMPSAGAVSHPQNGFSWFDACDADIQDASGNVPVGCARLIIKPDAVEVGHIAYDGAPMKPVYIISNGQRVAKFTPTGVEFFVPVKAPSFSN